MLYCLSAKSKGFTLVELVVTIVILGVLAVSAAPKFAGLKSDATVASLKTMKGSFKSTNAMVYAKAIFKGANTKYSEHVEGQYNDPGWAENCSKNNCIEIDGVWLYLKNAYLDRNSVAFATDADISGRVTRQVILNNKYITIPNRNVAGYNTKCTDSKIKNKVCDDHDFCQCRYNDKSVPITFVVDGVKKTKNLQLDAQRFIPRGHGYNGRCYLEYTSAEYYTGYAPVYTLVTDDC